MRLIRWWHQYRLRRMEERLQVIDVQSTIIIKAFPNSCDIPIRYFEQFLRLKTEQVRLETRIQVHRQALEGESHD